MFNVSLKSVLLEYYIKRDKGRKVKLICFVTNQDFIGKKLLLHLSV